MAQRKALIVGGSGLVGTHLAQALREQGWPVACAQRRPPAGGDFDEVVAVDVLADVGALASLKDVTHLFFLARVWEAGYVIGHQPNVDALRNVLDAVYRGSTHEDTDGA